jgi:H+-transporting ATPase
MKPTKRKPHHQKPSDDDIEGGNHNSNGAVNMGIESQDEEDFEFSFGLTSEECESLLKIYGKNELPEKIISSWFVIMNLLLEPMPVMIWLAIVIEAILLKWMDMTILLGIQLANASISFYEISKAGNAVTALKVSFAMMQARCCNHA